MCAEKLVKFTARNQQTKQLENRKTSTTLRTLLRVNDVYISALL